MSALSPKQEAFCREYIVDFNATKAAIRAGYSEASARGQGYRMLTKADIKQRVDELRGEAAARNDVTVDETIAMWRKIWGSSSAEVAKGEGDNVAVEMVDYPAACKAADALSKVAGSYEKDNKQQTDFTIAWGGDGK